MTKNKFNDAGAIERKKLSELASKIDINCMVMMPEFCVFDAISNRGDKVIAFEAKCRNAKSDRYDDLVLEKDKYDSLMDVLSDHIADMVFYVNFFTDGAAYLWNIRKIQALLKDGAIIWRQEPFVKTTMGNEQKVMKIVCYLPKSEAKYIQL